MAPADTAEAEATAPTEVPSDVEAPTEVQAEAEKSNEDIFKWSEWVHIGQDADECDQRFSGKCKEDGHFHAWIRLPNPFQIRDIVEKARAAKARRLRMLRKEDSDAREILEGELYDLKESGEAVKGILADEILDKDFPDFFDQATKTVMELDDPNWTPNPEKDDEEVPKLYENIEQDREEYFRQRELPEEEREPEYAELESGITAYSKAIEQGIKEITDPRREALIERPVDELIDIIRHDRMEQQGTEAYLHAYNTWMWYVCTYKPAGDRVATERVWSNIARMKYEAPSDVIVALKDEFAELEGRMARSRQAKNS